MTSSSLLRSSLCLLLIAGAGCDLLRTEDPEKTPGRGAVAFDPYSGTASGALRLSLQMYNGCAMLPTGTPVAKGTLNIPYPAQCVDVARDASRPTQPTGTLNLLSGGNYFLNQLTLMDAVATPVALKPLDPAAPTADRAMVKPDPRSSLTWFRNESRFKSLDWSDLSFKGDEWSSDFPPMWNREASLSAAWMHVKDDTFTIDVLDADGQVRNSITYERKDLLASAAAAGHSRVAWRLENIAAPLFPGDTSVRVVPSGPGVPNFPPVVRNVVRVDLVGSTNPFKSFRMPDLSGPGVVRVTWSQMPTTPFHFPVNFIRQQELPPTCFGGADGLEPVPCGFGLDPRVQLSKPVDGSKVFQPGETFDLLVDIRDSEGNRLHHPSKLPSFAAAFSGRSNGLLYFFYPHYQALLEQDVTSSYQVAGPIDSFKTLTDPNVPQAYYNLSAVPASLAQEPALDPSIPGVFDAEWPTRIPVTLPPNAQPGTYVAIVKANRYFLGERITRTTSVFFQVGKAEFSGYPNRVGNCQICHRGVLSMENLRHGASVDHVESCKVCHNMNVDNPGRIAPLVHDIHFNSTSYKADKSDCTLCHLTRESAIRPSVDTCSSCHPSVHGDEYFNLKFANTTSPSRFGTCAQSCHVMKAPGNHILPEN